MALAPRSSVPNPWVQANKVRLVLLSQIHLYRVRLCIASTGGRAAAFLVAPKNFYFWRLCAFCLYSACAVNETLKNAPLDVAIAVDTAENQLFKVEIKVKVKVK